MAQKGRGLPFTRAKSRDTAAQHAAPVPSAPAPASQPPKPPVSPLPRRVPGPANPGNWQQRRGPKPRIQQTAPATRPETGPPNGAGPASVFSPGRAAETAIPEIDSRSQRLPGPVSVPGRANGIASSEQSSAAPAAPAEPPARTAASPPPGSPAEPPAQTPVPEPASPAEPATRAAASESGPEHPARRPAAAPEPATGVPSERTGRTGSPAAESAAAPPSSPPAAASGPGSSGEQPGGAVARRAGSGVEPVTGPIVRVPGSEVERADRAVAPRAAPEVTPSWGQVASTTMRLWLQRRSTGWRLVTALILLIVVFAAGALTVGLTRHNGSGTAAHHGTAPGSAPVARLRWRPPRPPGSGRRHGSRRRSATAPSCRVIPRCAQPSRPGVFPRVTS